MSAQSVIYQVLTITSTTFGSGNTAWCRGVGGYDSIQEWTPGKSHSSPLCPSMTSRQESLERKSDLER